MQNQILNVELEAFIFGWVVDKNPPEPYRGPIETVWTYVPQTNIWKQRRWWNHAPNVSPDQNMPDFFW